MATNPAVDHGGPRLPGRLDRPVAARADLPRRPSGLPRTASGRLGRFTSRHLVGNLPGPGWEFRADLGREACEVVVAGEFLQAIMRQRAGAFEVTTVVGQTRLQE